MSASQPALLELDDWFARELPGLHEPWQAAPAPAAELLVLNDELATSLGLAPGALRTPEGVATLVGNRVPDGAQPVAQAYAGHQFGGYSPRLGDGRALLLGELVDDDGRRFDLHLKGSGRTPFARGGDGKAAVGPMLREYLIAEAMHALGIRTTRALAVVATGESVRRETMLPGAVLARVASSHLRVGTFQYAAATGDVDLVRDLADHAIDRHHPELAGTDDRYLHLYEAVVGAQAELVASWMLVGFIHGVMNTDNTTISGETIDYGPCAFMDRFDPATVFSSIDHGGRYAYGNQPQIVQWNLARLAETMLPLFDEDSEVAVARATEAVQRFEQRYEQAWQRGTAAKLGLTTNRPGDDELVSDLLGLLQAHGGDFTSGFRALSAPLRGDRNAVAEHLGAGPDAQDWMRRHLERLGAEGGDPTEVAAAMDSANPRYIPRNHLVEEALEAATAGDLGPFTELLEVVTHPFEERPGWERYAQAAPHGGEPYQTFCGT